MKCDVAVIGAGPAGLSGAVAAAQHGCRVVVVDAYARPGGQYFKQLPAEFHAQNPYAAHHDAHLARVLNRGVEASSNIEVLTNTVLWAADRPSHGAGDLNLHVLGQDGRPMLQAQNVILAPGAYDRGLPFPGWDIPGVITAGAAQTLTKSQRILPGRRIVLSGAGPFLLTVAAGLAEAGAEVVAVCEATPALWTRPCSAKGLMRQPEKLVEGLAYMKTLREHRIPMRFRHAVTRVTGSDRVESAIVQRLADDWTPIAGSEQEIGVDTVCIGYGFMPATEASQALGCAHRYDPRMGAAFAQHDQNMLSSQPGVFVAGEITGVRGSSVAIAQGVLAGLAAARNLGRMSVTEARQIMEPVRKSYDRRRQFGDSLMPLYTPGAGWMHWLTDDTVVCRCEEVTYRRLRAAIEDFHAHDVKTVKSITRCGMGPCQGRACSYGVTAVTARLSGRPAGDVGSFSAHPIVRPVPLTTLA